MRRMLALSSFALAVAFGLTLVANEKPTEDFSNIMKSNGMTRAALVKHTMAKDYDGIASDAATFKGNFAKVETFWTAKKVNDAVGFAKAAGKAAADLETAAKAKDDAAIATSTMALTSQCAACHMAHREQLPDKTFEIK